MTVEEPDEPSWPHTGWLRKSWLQKVGTVAPVVLSVGTLVAVGLTFTGHTAWIDPIVSSEPLASVTTCLSAGTRQLDERAVRSTGSWYRRTDKGTVATGHLWTWDRKKLEAAARNSPPPPQASAAGVCSDPTGYTVTYAWRYNGQDIVVTQNMYAPTYLPVELELERLATKLD